MSGEMSRPRLYLLIAAAVSTAMMVASLAADWAGRSLIDTRTFNALCAVMLGLWICYSIATCTGLVLRVMNSQERERGARVAAMMTDSGLKDLDSRRNARVN